MNLFKKIAAVSLSACTAFGTIASAAPAAVYGMEATASNLTVASATADGNVVSITFENGLKGKITFLEEGIFRYNVDPKGEFSEYAPGYYSTASLNARIQAQPDSSDVYSKPAAAVSQTADAWVVSSGSTSILFSKTDGTMTVKSGDKTVMSEAEPLTISSSGSVQTLTKNEGEDFFGGGTQNGRFVHTGKSIEIANKSTWTDGGVASPNPFYWSSNGYGVLRNTWQNGVYTFGGNTSDTVVTTHQENEFDAYYFVSGKETKGEVAQELLQDFYQVSGSPVLLPEYGFYLGHLNCYNRDGWDDSTGANAWTWKFDEDSSSQGVVKSEYGKGTGYVLPSTLSAETLNGTAPTVNADNFNAKDTAYKYSARSVIDDYADADMPFGWFLPNDGYGCGYGQNGYYELGGTAEERQAALDANVENLREFTEYANAHGVATGLWTQQNLEPVTGISQHLVRDFAAEVSIGGVTTLKTDVAWVGQGYNMELSGIRQAYNIISGGENFRPNIVTLDGWAGTQRYGAIWTGDQTGGNWEYIRFHIPTYIGQSLSGNPNVGSDMDGIFGGDPIISTRDFQWKTFTTHMLDMDGWGSYAKTPYTHGDPYTGISRMYLKLKAQLMPYIYTTAASAANLDTGNDDTGMPMIRAILFEDDSDYASSNAVMYEYLFGDSFLVAPVYQDTEMDKDGNDIRNNIYLPGTEEDVWIDYWTGDQYRGGQVLSGFDAPLWKLPVFVRSGAIIPMYEENNNPSPITEDNEKGLDKTKRIIEFYPDGDSEYTLYEDDGTYINNEITEDPSWGTLESIDYGTHVSTHLTSSVDKDAKTATLTAEKSTGTYEGYDSNRVTKFVVNVSEKPTQVLLNGTAGKEAASLEAFEALGDNESGWFYDAAPEMNKYAAEGSGFAEVSIKNSPKVYVKFARTDVSAASQTAVIKGFVNEGDLPADVLLESVAAPVVTVNEEATTPESIEIQWTAVENAVAYDIAVGGVQYSVSGTSFTHTDLSPATDYTYTVRTRTAEGYSKWSEPVTATTALDPWRNVPDPVDISWSGKIYGSHNASLAFDHIFQSGDGGFHSNNGGINETLTLDYGLVYNWDKLEYYPRDDAGNGTVTKMDVQYSIDGVHWKDLPQQTWARSADMKEMELDVQARYFRLIPRESVGTFFAASEIALYKVDGSNGYALGSNLNLETVTESDYSNMKNYLGLENREPVASTFNTQIKGHFADINDNDVYDVYDYSFTMAALDGGTTKTGEPTGLLFFTSDKAEVKAGDTFTVTLQGVNVSNANALGGIFYYNADMFEAIVPDGTNGIIASATLRQMENLSMIRTGFEDRVNVVNVAFANRGDKALYSGTGPIATFQMKALKDATIDLSDSSDLSLKQWTCVVGPKFDEISGVASYDLQIPEVPEPADTILQQSDFNLTITNDALPTDDGTNVETLVQQNNYDGLFNGANGVSDRDFEFKWIYSGGPDVDTDVVKVPATIHFALKTAKNVDSVKLYQGAQTSNGAVVKLKATATYADGTTQVFEGGNYEAYAQTYDFALNASKALTRFDLEILETTGAQAMNNLTLNEIEFTQKQVSELTAITADGNQTMIYAGDLVEVVAGFNPASYTNQYFTVTSSNPEVANVIGIQNGDQVAWLISGNKAGTADITLTAAGDPTVKTTYTLTVSGDINKTALETAVAKAENVPADRLSEASAAALQAALAKANAVLANESATRAQVEAAAAELNDVLASLQYTKPEEANLINKDANSGVTAIAWSSQCDAGQEDTTGLASDTLDKDDQTYWHSDWSDALYMPQYIIYNLGAEYTLSDVEFLARQNGRNGDIFEAEILVGSPEEGWTSVGTWSFEPAANGYQIANRGEYQTMTFAPVKTQYVKFQINHARGDNGTDTFASMSEINFYSAEEVLEDNVDTYLLEKALEAAKAADLSQYKSGEAADDTAFERTADDTDGKDSAADVLKAPKYQKRVNDAAAKLNNALLRLRLIPSSEKLNSLK